MSDYIYTDGELYHYGIKGMKWGVRRKAKKDAKEYARAKMFYGEGAGNRRKLIKAKVNERSKDPDYKAEFERQLAKQDMAKHATAAKRERTVKTAASATAKTGRGLVHAALGNIGKASAASATIYLAAKATGADKVVGKFAKEKISDMIGYVHARRDAAAWFKRGGR